MSICTWFRPEHIEDIEVTRALVEAGKLLEIELLDHLIIGQGVWMSMRERQLGW
ncbi:MAG TPA: JAB domain-containing protein [Ktedonobacteraceae bacterium]|nr:JAB domain-containing protein [Ktedonobacteraceae bacterium]